MKQLHQHLETHVTWYRAWHRNPHHHIVHYGFAAVFFVFTASLLFSVATVHAAGSIMGFRNSASTAINLSSEGTSDWIHLGDGSAGITNRKSGGGNQISTIIQRLCCGSFSTYANDPRPISWTAGTPTVSSSNNTNGISLPGQSAGWAGFGFSVPAGTGSRTVIVHVGGANVAGTLTATLSDGSAAQYTDTTTSVSGQFDTNYTLTYNAASAGQTLTIQWFTKSSTGSVTLSAVALGNIVVPPSPAGTSIPPATQIIDNNSNIWTVSGGVVYENAAPAAFSANVVELYWSGSTIYQKNNVGGWWYWNGTDWTATTDPTPSPAGTSIPSATQIVDTNSNTWTLSGGAQVVKNGVTDNTTSNVIKLYWDGSIVYQENSAGGWWYWNGTGWTSTTAPIPPDPPAALSATPGDTVVGLTWTASLSATSYNIKRAAVSGGPYSTITTVTTTSYSDSSLSNGTTYYYVVSASNAKGESANSPQASATPTGGGSSSSPIAWWKLDGNALDSVGTNNGTLGGSPTYVTGEVGQGLQFGGADTMSASSLNNASFPTTGTLTFWVNTATLTTDPVNILDSWSTRNHIFIRICSTGGGCNTGATSSGTRYMQVIFQKADSSYTYATTPTVLENTWMHVAVVWDTTSVTHTGKLYINGALSNSGTIGDATWTPNAQTVVFGQRFKGILDEVRLYNTALSSTDVNAVYAYTGGGGGTPDTTPPSTPTNLVGNGISSSGSMFASCDTSAGCVIDPTQHAATNVWTTSAIQECSGSCGNAAIVYVNPSTGLYRQSFSPLTSPWVPTQFRRTVFLTGVDASPPQKQLRVTSVVTYPGYGKTTQTISVSEDLYNWFPYLH